MQVTQRETKNGADYFSMMMGRDTFEFVPNVQNDETERLLDKRDMNGLDWLSERRRELSMYQPTIYLTLDPETRTEAERLAWFQKLTN
jgi:hypothetical protein